jgi:glycosyltransferase involved in cell wall biosynthesis
MTAIHEPVSIIIPAYNEENGINELIRNVKETMDQSPYKYEIVVIDDGSTDRTSMEAKGTGARILRHLKNRGYGAALKTGIRAAKYDVIVITDADGTYPSEVIPEIVGKLDGTDMVVGARTGQNVNIPLVRRPAKWILGKLATYITGEKIPDLNSGLRAFRRTCVMQYLPILSDRFSFTTTMTVAMLSDNYNVTYMPIDYFSRTGKSKIVPWDFINFIALVLRLSMLFEPLKIFVPVSLSFLALGFVKFVLDIIFSFQRLGALSWEVLRKPTVSTTTLIFILSGFQILLIGMVSDGLVRKISQRIPSEYKSQSVVVDEESGIN